MAFNPALGREQEEGTVDGLVGPSGLVWDNVNNLWRRPTGEPAPPSEVSQQVDEASRQDSLGNIGTGGLLALSVGVPIAAQGLQSLGAEAAQGLAGALGFGGPAAPELLSAARVPGAAIPTSPGLATPELLGASRVPEAAGVAQAPSALAQGLTAAGGIAGAVGIGDLLASSQRGNQLGSTLQGAASGAAIGNAIPGFGTLAGGLVGGLLGLGKSFEGGKNEDQIRRDAVRSQLQQRGVLDEGFNLTLADGSKFDLGRDGEASFESFDKTRNVRAGFEVDETNPLSPIAISLVNPLAEIVSGGDDKLRSDFASQFTNAIVSNANGDIGKVVENANALFQRAGFQDQNQVFAELDRLRQENLVTPEQQEVFRLGAAQSFGTQPLSFQDPSLIPEPLQVAAPVNIDAIARGLL